MSTHEGIARLKETDWIPPDIRAGMHRELNRQEAAYDETVQPAHDAAGEAARVRIRATLTVFETVPTTLAGMRTKIAWAFSVDHVTDLLLNDDAQVTVRRFLETFYEAARMMAVRS